MQDKIKTKNLVIWLTQQLKKISVKKPVDIKLVKKRKKRLKDYLD